MADLLDFIPLRQEDIDSIRARINADANAGLTPDDDGYLDTIPGGFWWDITQAAGLEIERLWDFASTELPAAMFLIYSFGTYLDDHGEALDTARKAAVAATGEARFTGTASTMIATGTQIGTLLTDPDEEPRAYRVSAGGAIPDVVAGLAATPSATGGSLATGTYNYVVTAILPDTETTACPNVTAAVPTLAAPTGLTATPSTTGGSLAAGTYYYKVTALNANGETVGSTEVSAVTTGTTSSIALAWTAVAGATSYRVYRGTTTNGQNTYYTASGASFTDTGAAGTAGTVPTTNTATVSTGSVLLDWADVTGATGYKVYRGTTATNHQLVTTIGATSTYTDTGTATTATSPPTTAAVVLPVIATETGSFGNSASGTLTVMLTPVAGIATVTNPDAITGGADVESDESYRDRLLLEFAGIKGAGTISDYVRWGLAYEGVGNVTVQPLHFGAGTVRVMVTDSGNDPVSSAIVDGLQARIDPYSATTKSSGAQTLPVATLNVDATTGFRASGTIRVGGSQFVTYTGVTATSFTGCTGGTGAVPDDTPVRQAGEGRGLAPIGADVVVSTPAALGITITATIVFESGYSLDGDEGEIATRADLVAAVTSYVDELDVGEDVVLNHVEARFFRVRGVYDVTGTQINGTAANRTVTPDQVAQLTAITLT